MKKRDIQIINEALKLRSGVKEQLPKPLTKPTPKVGDRVWFSLEKRPYRVRACDSRFIICTKPFNAMKTVLYTIIDLQQDIRGTENLIFCEGFETDEKCQEALVRLQTGETEVSYRNRVRLDITRIDNK